MHVQSLVKKSSLIGSCRFNNLNKRLITIDVGTLALPIGSEASFVCVNIANIIKLFLKKASLAL